MKIEMLYILLPIILWPLTWVILAKYGRKIGSYTTAFYRQFTIFIVSIFIVYSLFEKHALLSEYSLYIFGASISWFVYLISNFYSTNLLPFSVMRIFYDSSRMIFGLFLWYFFLSEQITFYDVVWIIFLFIGFYLFSLSRIDTSHLQIKNIPLWVTLSVINWGLFIMSSYYFKLYAQAFSPMQAAVILEVLNGICIGLFLLCILMFQQKNYFRISLRDCMLFLCMAPLSLFATYGLAKTYEFVSFYVINLLFILQFIFSVFFSYLFLKEKLSYSQIFPTIVIIVSLALIVLY